MQTPDNTRFIASRRAIKQRFAVGVVFSKFIFEQGFLLIPGNESLKLFTHGFSY